MKINFNSIIFTLLAPTALALPQNPPSRGDLQCGSMWAEGGLSRLSFNWTGFCTDRWGQCFLDAIRQKGVSPINWQAWSMNDGTGRWQMEFSVKPGEEQAAIQGLSDFIGKWFSCWGINV